MMTMNEIIGLKDEALMKVLTLNKFTPLPDFTQDIIYSFYRDQHNSDIK